jgi:putative transposase
MTYNPEIHQRRSIRLKGYDYSQAGAYFVTICSWNKECIFGEITNGEMHLNELGRIVSGEWHRSSEIRKEIELDTFLIMPNHIHGIVVINAYTSSYVGANGRSPLQMKPKSISSFVAGFKSSVTKQINQIRNTPGIPVWQRNYYEHIIRNEKELNQIREYIVNNPIQWELDTENPQNTKGSKLKNA